jgi:hypothetical protein
VKLNLDNPTYDGVYEVKSVQLTSFTVATPLLSGSASVTSVIKLLSVSRAIIDANVIELPLGVSGISAVTIDDNNDTTPYAETPDYVHGDILVLKQASEEREFPDAKSAEIFPQVFCEFCAA